MSQITCCPACGTMFRVVADQLRISEGWVRCGHCAEVFDATAQLQDGATADVSVTPTAPGTDIETRTDPETGTEAQTGTEFVDSLDAAEPASGSEREPVAAHDGVGQPTVFAPRDVPDEGSKSVDRSDAGEESAGSTETPERPAEPQESSATEALPTRFQPSLIAADAHRSPGPTVAARSTRNDKDPAPSDIPSGWNRSGDEQGYPPFELRRADHAEDEPEDFFTPPDVNSGWTAPEVPDEEQAAQDVSFIRDARRREFWRRPLVRMAGVALAVLLLVALVAQYAVHDRNRLASVHPQLRPVLAALCQPLDCSIGPLRRIDAVAIDSSAFTKLRPDVYRLAVSLKNQGEAAVAMPALELTLTDASDQPVLRRVLAPRELGATSEVIAGSGEWSGVVSLTVAANGNAERIAGYRLLAFYP